MSNLKYNMALLLSFCFIFISGCESDFDKCYKAEIDKVISTQNEHPLLKAYLDLDKFSIQKIIEYIIVIEKFGKSFGPQPKGCETDYNSQICRDFRNDYLRARESAVKSSGLESLDDAYIKVRFLELENMTSDSLVDKIMGINSSYGEKRKNLQEGDFQKSAELEIYLRVEIRKILTNYVKEQLGSPLKLATEICNQRGLYE